MAFSTRTEGFILKEREMGGEVRLPQILFPNSKSQINIFCLWLFSFKKCFTLQFV